jgi:hypothetical protein
MNATRAPVASSGVSPDILMYGFYIVVAIGIAYYVSGLVFKSASQDIVVTGATQSAVPAKGATPFKITDDPLTSIKSGGEYTFTFWTYINSWGDGTGKPKNVLTLTDSRLANNALMAVMLYPSDPKMAIRLYTGLTSGYDYTNNTNRRNLMTGAGGNLMGSMASMPKCDLQDIDLQRWINITVSVHGRVVDVYYDGKLARSCILPSIILAGSGSKFQQSVVIGEYGGFQGSFGLMNYYAYALTPDRIYSIYLAGPGGPPTFTKYLEKLAINILYSSKDAAGDAPAA